MQFSDQGELAGSVRFHNAPGLLLAFVVLSVLAHGATLLFSAEPALTLPTQRFGTTIISTILSPVEKDAPASTVQNLHFQKKTENEPRKKLFPTTKPAINITPEKTPTIIARTKNRFEPASEKISENTPAIGNNKQTGTPEKESQVPSPTTVSSLAAQKSKQRNYLLGELQNRLSKYLTYPLRARRRGWQGEVLVAFHIDKRGKLGNIRLAHSSGYSLLDHSAINAIAQLDNIGLPETLGPLQAMELQLPVRYQLRDS